MQGQSASDGSAAAAGALGAARTAARLAAMSSDRAGCADGGETTSAWPPLRKGLSSSAIGILFDVEDGLLGVAGGAGDAQGERPGRIVTNEIVAVPSSSNSRLSTPSGRTSMSLMTISFTQTFRKKLGPSRAISAVPSALIGSS